MATSTRKRWQPLAGVEEMKARDGVSAEAHVAEQAYRRGCFQTAWMIQQALERATTEGVAHRILREVVRRLERARGSTRAHGFLLHEVFGGYPGAPGWQPEMLWGSSFPCRNQGPRGEGKG